MNELYCRYFVHSIFSYIMHKRVCSPPIAQSGATRISERNRTVLKMSDGARGSGKSVPKYSQFRIPEEEERGGGGGGGKQTNNGSFAFKDRLQKTRLGQNSPSVIISEHNSPFDGSTFVWLFVIYDHPVLRPFIHNSLNEPVIMAAPAQLTQG